MPGKVVQYTGLSTWKDCINQITNQGTIDAHWDDTNKICNTLQIPDYSNPTPPSSWSINSFQPTQLIQCSGANSPCPNCKSNDDFVSAIKCSGTDTPCTNCKKADDYICDTCQPPTNTNGWNFTTCAPNDSNGNTVQVVSYGSGSGSGNCPWGCSSVNGGGNCYNFDIPTGSSNIFGQPLSSTNDIVCMQDGQIHFEPKNQIIKYAFDQTQGICIESPSGTTSSICECMYRNLEISYKLGNFVAYIVVNNKKYYMYNDKDSFYKFTNNINDNILSGGNITINDDGSASINGDIIILKIPNIPNDDEYTGYIAPNPPYSGNFQLAKPLAYNELNFGNYTYLPLSLVIVDGNIFPIQGIKNFSPGQALTWFIPSSQQTIDSTWVNQTITDFLKLTPTDNYIHIVPFKLEQQSVNNNCTLYKNKNLLSNI